MPLACRKHGANAAQLCLSCIHCQSIHFLFSSPSTKSGTEQITESSTACLQFQTTVFLKLPSVECVSCSGPESDVRFQLSFRWPGLESRPKATIDPPDSKTAMYQKRKNTLATALRRIVMSHAPRLFGSTRGNDMYHSLERTPLPVRSPHGNRVRNDRNPKRPAAACQQ